jgi:2'-5' RNA ligase
VRVFLAVPGDPDWCASAREFAARWRPRLPPATWTKPESWHLTLRFLGEIDEATAVRFADAIGSAPPVPEVALPPGGPVVFPPHGRPRVAGVGFAPGAGVDALAEAARTAERAARAIGSAAEERPYRPHVTLARLREPWGRGAVETFREAASAWPFPEWRVRSIVLYQSRLHPSGAVHTPLREWPASASLRGKTA